jgi:hypothetical protein
LTDFVGAGEQESSRFWFHVFVFGKYSRNGWFWPAETAAMLFWALLASGQITMRKVDGWQSLAEKPSDQIIDLAA